MGLIGESHSNGHANSNGHGNGYPRQPLKQDGLLNERFESDDLTPVIGPEFPKANIVDDLLNSTNADTLLRNLAITSILSFLILQINTALTNTIHEFGHDNEITTISSLTRKKLFGAYGEVKNPRRYDAAQRHSDIHFETCPADYTSPKLTQLPKNGGDTLWASGYELYDRFSHTYQKFLEGLIANFIGDGFIKAEQAGRTPLYDQPRGSPKNVGKALTAVHPIVRTSPVTGWKRIFAVGSFPKTINELNTGESDELLAKFRRMIAESHDLQVRFKWRNEHDIAIWDNRSVFHCATFDYDDLGERLGNRAVGIAEEPYLDPNSLSRSEGLAAS